MAKNGRALQRNNTTANQGPKKENSIPRNRMEVLKWNDWGYIDTTFRCDENGNAHVTSDRYQVKHFYISEEVRKFCQNNLNFDIYKGFGPNESQLHPTHFPKSIINKEFMKEIKKLNIPFSIEGKERFFRGHGMTLSENMTLREGTFKRIPDIVTWPNCHDDVVQLVQLASKLNVVIVPFGGGTNVTRALECSTDEKRMIVSLDTSQMCRMLWVDKTNMMACCEAGIIGQDLNAALKKHGVTMGHEPDSLEFSSLGGWVATRASGMKKNQYGNIEDLVVHVKFVTPSGVLEKSNMAPRISCGPDLHNLALGSEGTLGVVTEVTFKIRPIPEVQEFDSFVFPTFQHGIDFMREVAQKRYQPAALRLVDNVQLNFGKIFNEKHSWFGSIIESLKMLYVTMYKGINLKTMCAAIALFEGDACDVAPSKSKIIDIASKYGGFSGGSHRGRHGYFTTFVIGYFREVFISHNVMGESFETALPWDRVAIAYRNVIKIINQKCKEFGIQHYLASGRLSQVYDTGACVYFYLVFNCEDVENPVDKYYAIDRAAKEEILRLGGSPSHHHGIGKVRRDLYPSQVSPVGVAVYRAVKQALDPNNVFACGNLLPQNDDLIIRTNSRNGSVRNGDVK